MLTVWCVCVGKKYTDDYVHRLKAMVERHTKQDHRFLCLTDRDIAGVDCFYTPVDWPGWWQKLYLFEAAHSLDQARSANCGHLYLDLDVVVVGQLDDLVSPGQLSMPKNWAMSGHGGCQSSVMSWGWDYSTIADQFTPSLLSKAADGNYGYYGPTNLWGDQEFITSLYGEPGTNIHAMQGIYSYKYHCRGGLPEDARVVCFHGQPKPHEVSDPWVVDARRYTH